ncbi:MAG: STAS-like domain-containing protein [Candidatus Abawacabacteria bacterium]|nr:STAS-like domain-containing protein [Candidatus Abawacabacteria bacterium]
MKRKVLNVKEIIERDYATDIDMAILLFHQIQELIEDDTQVTLDFIDINDINENFLEELISLLYESYSSNFISTHLRHKNCNEFHKEYIADAIRAMKKLYKLDESYQDLFPFINKPVETPEGEGILWQVFADRIGVVCDTGERDHKGNKIQKVFFFDPLFFTTKKSRQKKLSH